MAFLIRELVVKNPIVNLKIFKDRNFAIGCILIGAVGAVLYGMITLLPLFYQTLMNYTAWAAGLAVSPRGIGAILIMPVVGVLTAKMDNRYLIGVGFAIFAWSCLVDIESDAATFRNGRCSGPSSSVEWARG